MLFLVDVTVYAVYSVQLFAKTDASLLRFLYRFAQLFDCCCYCVVIIVNCIHTVVQKKPGPCYISKWIRQCQTHIHSYTVLRTCSLFNMVFHSFARFITKRKSWGFLPSELYNGPGPFNHSVHVAYTVSLWYIMYIAIIMRYLFHRFIVTGRFF